MGLSADQLAHIVAAIDELALLTDITGEDLGEDFVAWINGEAAWITAEMESGMVLDPAVAEYVAAVGAARLEVIDGIYETPNGTYEFGEEVTTIVRLYDRIAALAQEAVPTPEPQ